MKAIHSMIAALALAFALPASADAAVGGPEVIIYRFPGVSDDGGGPNVGVTTVFHCTNFSGVQETVRFAGRSDAGGLVVNGTININHLATAVVFTHLNAAYVGVSVTTGSVNSGTMAIAATSINIICTAMTIDAANPKPTGVALRGIRFSPVPGSQE
jgi:hypothetical protein